MSVSDAELKVLKQLWEHGPSTVRQVNERLLGQRNRWAHNTVLTLLTRLREKGFVNSDTAGVAHVFESVVSREQLLRRRLVELAEEVCDGTTSPLVHALVSGGEFSAEEITELRQLVKQLEQKPPKRKSRRS